MEKVFRNIEESAKGSQSESDFAGLFDDFDVNSNKLGATVAKRNDKLTKLLNGVADMNLGDVKGHDIDAFGDAYEYLMTMYASNAGKSGGEFYTPADVSELLTRLGTVGKTEINKVYDPACGSGSLLLKAEKVLGRDAVRNGFFGQEAEKECFKLVKQKYNDIQFFGTSVEDEVIQKAFQEAKENPDPSRFPDFIFDNGFIEHFSVTSSFQNKHGSTMKRENAEIEREFNQLASAYVNSLPKDNPTVYSVEAPMCFHEMHSYENFVKSFKWNYEDHIENRSIHGH